jgi:hypothetical protein
VEREEHIGSVKEKRKGKLICSIVFGLRGWPGKSKIRLEWAERAKVRVSHNVHIKGTYIEAGLIKVRLKV